MELKRVIASIIFFFYSSNVFGDFVFPSKTLKPQDVLKIQLDALKIMTFLEMTLESSRHGYLHIQTIKR